MADVLTQSRFYRSARHGAARAHVAAKGAPGDRSDSRAARGGRAADLCGSRKSARRKHIEKVLRSAIANAERKAEDAGASLDVDQLFVSKCFVNEGSRWKRLRPAPMGRAFRYQKRTAHILVGVAEHHVAAAERVAAIERKRKPRRACAEPSRRVRKALTGQASTPRRRRREEVIWDRRHIRTGSAWATTSPGSRAGMPTAIMPTCFTKT